MLNLDEYTAIIFDLGNVVIELDEEYLLSEFSKLTDLNEKEIWSRYLELSEVYEAHETGHLSDEVFRLKIREGYGIYPDVSDQHLDDVWSLILKGIPKGIADPLQELKKTHRLFVLSNTNSIHFKRFEEIAYRDLGNGLFKECFEKTYYSNEIGLRKPDPRSWQLILNQNSLEPEKTLFLDDRLENIEAANELGIKAVHVPSPQETIKVLNVWMKSGRR